MSLFVSQTCLPLFTLLHVGESCFRTQGVCSINKYRGREDRRGDRWVSEWRCLGCLGKEEGKGTNLSPSVGGETGFHRVLGNLVCVMVPLVANRSPEDLMCLCPFLQQERTLSPLIGPCSPWHIRLALPCGCPPTPACRLPPLPWLWFWTHLPTFPFNYSLACFAYCFMRVRSPTFPKTYSVKTSQCFQSHQHLGHLEPVKALCLSASGFTDHRQINLCPWLLSTGAQSIVSLTWF